MTETVKLLFGKPYSIPPLKFVSAHIGSIIYEGWAHSLSQNGSHFLAILILCTGVIVSIVRRSGSTPSLARTLLGSI